MHPLPVILFPFVLFLSVTLGGCVSTAGQRLADGLSRAILDQDDPSTVRDGAPAFLLLIDGMIDQNPDDPALLLAGARLYSAYSSAFVEDPERARTMARKARGYARSALCAQAGRLCAALDAPYPEFAHALEGTNAGQVAVLYGYAAAWAGWIQTAGDDWKALADLPKVQALFERVLALDEAYEQGGAHLYLGVLASLRPPALGGRPQTARRHFERALELSAGRNLMAKVLYAKHYARQVFDRTLHDRLLREVLEAPAEAPGLTLINTLAKDQARALLAGGPDYF